MKDKVGKRRTNAKKKKTLQPSHTPLQHSLHVLSEEYQPQMEEDVVLSSDLL
jgi:hypothetical protein